jgi:hypothetical protein
MFPGNSTECIEMDLKVNVEASGKVLGVLHRTAPHQVTLEGKFLCMRIPALQDHTTLKATYRILVLHSTPYLLVTKSNLWVVGAWQ